jgi:hypothetical protein
MWLFRIRLRPIWGMMPRYGFGLNLVNLKDNLAYLMWKYVIVKDQDDFY